MSVPRDATGHAPEAHEGAALADGDGEQRLAKGLQHRDVLIVGQNRAPCHIARSQVQASNHTGLRGDERQALLTGGVEQRVLGEANILAVPANVTMEIDRTAVGKESQVLFFMSFASFGRLEKERKGEAVSSPKRARPLRTRVQARVQWAGELPVDFAGLILVQSQGDAQQTRA